MRTTKLPSLNSQGPAVAEIRAPEPTSPDKRMDNCPDDSSETDTEDNTFMTYMKNISFDMFEEVDGDERIEGTEVEDTFAEIPFITSPDDDKDAEEASLVLSKLKTFMRRPVFLGIVSLYGKTRYTL